jgi:beta-lactamase class A
VAAREPQLKKKLKRLTAGIFAAGLLVFCCLLMRDSSAVSLPVDVPSIQTTSAGTRPTVPSTAAGSAAETTVSETAPTTAPTVPLPSVPEDLEGNQPPLDTLKREFSLSADTAAMLDAAIGAYGDGVSVYYRDLGSGAEYEYRALDKYPAASVIKAPYCMYVYSLISQGKADPDQIFVYTEEYTQGGTGLIQKMELGTELTLRQLLTLAIRESDNIAFAMLRKVFPVSGYKEYVSGIGLRFPEDIRWAANSLLCARDAGIYMTAIDAFIRSDPHGPDLEYDMRRTKYPLIRSSYPIARKYGWMEGAYHDAAIVYAPHPYVLVILSDRDGGTKEDRAMFADISRLIQQVSGN